MFDFDSIKKQISHIDEPSLMAFSAGKDSIAAADIWYKNKGPKPKAWVYFYYVKGLSFVDSILDIYERRFDVKIHQRPCADHKSLKAKAAGDRKKKFLPKDDYRDATQEFDCRWIITGMKRSDSFARRGMLKAVHDGIDPKTGFVYPLINWTEKEVRTYCKMHKLPLPITYSMGINNSVWVPNPELLLWLKVNFSEDYRKIIAEFPELEHAIWRMQNAR